MKHNAGRPSHLVSSRRPDYATSLDDAPIRREGGNTLYSLAVPNVERPINRDHKSHWEHIYGNKPLSAAGASRRENPEPGTEERISRVALLLGAQRIPDDHAKARGDHDRG